jgi:hypothetical protein
MPPNTVLLSAMMRELSATPGFTDALLAKIEKGGKNGPALMTPELMKRLRELILGKDWQRLDRFPGWTMQGVNPAVKVISKEVEKKEAPVTPVGTPSGNASASPRTGKVEDYIDLGPYALDRAETISLNEPSTLSGFTTDGIVSELGGGITRGDGANASLAPLHAESQRLADVLNRLSLNQLQEASPFTAELVETKDGSWERMFVGRESRSPEELVSLLISTGHTVVVSDARYFANFGHFHFKGQDVMMPFFIDSQIAIPGTKPLFGAARSLLVPVSHAEYEWEIRGPKVNANVSFYFGIDGKAEFRTMDTQDQAWVLGHHAHEYRDADALEVTRLVGKMLVAYVHQHVRRPDLPFGGYYALGVCQDGVAAIEKKMTGKATLFPNTADGTLFDDPSDAEINELIQAIPKDRNGVPPEPERIFGSLPVADFNAITIPGLAADVIAVHDAWRNGDLERTQSRLHRVLWQIAGVVTAMAVVGVVWWRRRRRAH